jgi:hypothetical protein
MRLSRRLNRTWWAARLQASPAIAIAAVFIVVSGLMSITFGYRLGEPSGNALIFAAVALGIEGFADLSLPLFWRRLKLFGRMVLIAFFGLCLAYKLEAAKRFAAENLGKRDVAIATAEQDYVSALQKVEQLRKAISDNVDARSPGLVQTEIDALLRDPRAQGCVGAINGIVTREICPKVDRLRGEIARAETRDKAQADLTPALTALRGATTKAGGLQESAGPVMAALTLAGLSVGSWSSFIATLLMAIVEAGAIVVPMLIGAAFGDARERRSPESSGPGPSPGQASASPGSSGGEPESPPGLPAGLTERGRRDFADVAAFLGACSDRAAGERLQSAQLYLVYCEWKQRRSEQPITVAQFGVVMTRHLGFGKLKSDGKHWYLSLRLRHPAQGRREAKHLRAVA